MLEAYRNVRGIVLAITKRASSLIGYLLNHDNLLLATVEGLEEKQKRTPKVNTYIDEIKQDSRHTALEEVKRLTTHRSAVTSQSKD